MKRVVWVAVILVTLFSCNNASDYYNPDSVVEKGRAVCADSMILGYGVSNRSSIAGLVCIDDYLIILQENNDTLFRIIDVSTDSLLSSFGRIGHARDEFQGIPSTMYCSKDKSGQALLFIQEAGHTKVINLSKSIAAHKCVLHETIKEKNYDFFTHTYHLGKGRTFAYKALSYVDPREGVFFPPVYSLLDSEEETRWNIYPQIIRPSFQNIVDCAYDNVTMVSPDCHHAVSVNNFIDIITIFDLQAKHTTGIMNPDSYSFEYMEKVITQSNAEEKLRWYNTSVCVTNNSFLVIEDGDLYAKDKQNVGSVIRCYDWQGTMHFSRICNKRLSQIAYFEQYRKLYAVEAYEKLYTYKL